jgi:hypothetical protein
MPTDGVEPAGSGTSLPARFVRKPVKTVEFEFQTKTRSSNGSHRYTDRFDQYTGRIRPVPGRLTKKPN